MSIAIEIQIRSSNPGQQQEIVSRIHDLVSNNGFCVDRSTYTPSVEVQAELAAVETSRATVKVFES